MAACPSSAAAAQPRPPGRTSTSSPWTRGTGRATSAPVCCPAPTGSCQGIFLRYDLFGGRGPAMLIGNLPEGSPARELEEGQVPFEVAQLLPRWATTSRSTSPASRTCPVMQGDGLLIVRRIKISESRVACAQFDRSDGVQVTIATWDRPITDDLYQLLKPLPAEMFQAG